MRLVALSAIALLLLVTSVAAAHACDLAHYSGGQVKTSAAVTPDHSPCLICAAAHSPSVVSAFLPLTPKLITGPVASPIAALQVPSFPGFVLRVRPPPAS